MFVTRPGFNFVHFTMTGLVYNPLSEFRLITSYGELFHEQMNVMADLIKMCRSFDVD